MSTNMADVLSIIQGIVIGGIAVVATLIKNYYDVRSKDRELALKATELSNKTTQLNEELKRKDRELERKDRELALKATELNSKTNEFNAKLDFERERYENELARKRTEIRMDFESKYDISLRDLRLNAYKNLWLNLYPIRLHSRTGNIKYSEIRNLLRDLTKWYYDEGGGTFLSSKSRDLYTKVLLDRLQQIANYLKLDDEVVEDGQKIKDILDAGSELRSSLVDDVGTRIQLGTFFEGKQS